MKRYRALPCPGHRAELSHIALLQTQRVERQEQRSRKDELCVSPGDSSALPNVPEGDGVHGEAESSLWKEICPIVQRPSASRARELRAGNKYFDSEDEAPIVPAQQFI